MKRFLILWFLVHNVQETLKWFLINASILTEYQNPELGILHIFHSLPSMFYRL